MHFAATRALRRLKGSDTVSQQDRNGNLATKFLRIFAAQTEALQRYRGKGQQKVTIEHVHVHTGGQAIVGSVSQSAIETLAVKLTKPFVGLLSVPT